MTYRPGLMLVLEGIEGAGKSTSATHLHTYLHTKGIGALRTREPGGTPLAEELRNILLREHTEPIDPVAELLMLFASRAQHIAQRIKPALAMSHWVISERFTDATYAYQYGGRGVSDGMIAQLENMVQGAYRPNAVIILDLDPQVGMGRIKQRGNLDRFEREKVDFYSRVRDVYLSRAAAEPSRYFVINAEQPVQVIQRELQTIADQLILAHLNTHQASV